MRKSNKEPTISKRIKIIHITFIVLAILSTVFTFRWSVVQGAKFDLLAKSRFQNQTLTSMRGSIFAKDGTTLAYTEPRVKVTVWLRNLTYYEQRGIQTTDEFIRKVAPIISLTQDDLIKRFQEAKDAKGGSDLVEVTLATDLTKEKAEELRALTRDNNPNLPLLGIKETILPKRIYPEGRLASHVLGLTNSYKEDLIGEAGIERRYTDTLKPVEGLVSQETDARGLTITSTLLETIEPRNGSDIYITIDKKLQAVIEEKIEDGVSRYQAKSGTIIIQDPKSGEIMAMANFPDYDPNTREETNPNAYGDIAITSPYETGSIGKILTLATAIDLNLITPDSIVLPNGHQGCEKIHNDLLPVCTWDRKPQPPMSARDCFQKSDNLCFYHMASSIPRKDFYDHLVNFGVGYLSGIDLKEESIGYLKPYDSWNVGDVSAFSYGHGYLVNAVQAINSTSTIANFGVRMQPQIVDKIVSAEGEVTEYTPTVVNRAVSKEAAESVVDMMRYNFSKSIPEWQYWGLNSYDIGVKSGTALIANSSGYSVNINATFVGFDASPERTFVMLIRLEDPRVPEYDRLAFYNVRPLWLDTFIAVKDIIGVPTK